MHVLVSRIGLCALGLGLASSLNAATTVTGQISSSLTLIASCQVNGSGAATGLNFGSLNFGTTNSLFTNADAQLLGGTGTGGALSILCSAGTAPTIKVRAGAHDGASPVALVRWPMAWVTSCPTISTLTAGVQRCWRLTAW